MIVDLHCDTIFKILAGEDFFGGSENLEVTLPALKSSEIKLQVFAAYTSPSYPHGKSYSEAKHLLQGIDQLIENNPDELFLIEESGHIESLLKSKKTGILKAVENGQAIENSIAKLEALRRIGVRYMTLIHSRNHDWAASSAQESCNFDGLPPFGEKVIEAMNDLGIIVDVSHVHERTFWKVMGISRKPVIASHSNAYRLCRTSRNLTDDQIKAIADSGGMIGINFFPGFLDELYMEGLASQTFDLFQEMEKLEQESINDPSKLHKSMLECNARLRQRMNFVTVSLDRIVDHIVYIVELVGAEYVGFGSDFDGAPALPEGISGAGDIKKIVSRLKERGYSETQIQNICWDNFIRVLNQNE